MKYEITMNDELFHQKLRRDLLFVCFAPLVISDSAAFAVQQEMQRAVPLFVEKNFNRVLQMLPRPEPRLPLGKWFERIFLAALQITYPFKDVKHSVACNQGHSANSGLVHNSGELDFLILDHLRTIHIECAIKFFVHMPDLGHGLNSYIGPGGQDRLDLKLSKMRDVQLNRPIPSKYSEGQAIQKILWMSGQIHYPTSHDSNFTMNHLDYPGPINRNHNKGFWCYSNNMPQAFQGKILVKLPRPWWMTSLHGISQNDLNLFEVILMQNTKNLRHFDEPTLVAVVEYSEYKVNELCRGFILP